MQIKSSKANKNDKLQIKITNCKENFNYVNKIPNLQKKSPFSKNNHLSNDSLIENNVIYVKIDRIGQKTGENA